MGSSAISGGISRRIPRIPPVVPPLLPRRGQDHRVAVCKQTCTETDSAGSFLRKQIETKSPASITRFLTRTIRAWSSPAHKEYSVRVRSRRINARPGSEDNAQPYNRVQIGTAQPYNRVQIRTDQPYNRVQIDTAGVTATVTVGSPHPTFVLTTPPPKTRHSQAAHHPAVSAEPRPPPPISAAAQRP